MPHPDDYDDRNDDRRRDDRRDDRHDDHDADDYDDRPRRGGRERAAERVSLPAIFLMIVGGLGFGFAVFRTIVVLAVGIPNPHPFVNQNDPNAADMQKVMEIAEILGPVFNFVWAIIVFFGGLQMKRMRSRGFVLFSCIWAMLPCNLCCFLGIPFGIWALVVIGDESVKRAFSMAPRSESYE